MSILDVLNADNASFRVFVTWGGFLLIKMLFMSILTGIQRGRKGAVENPEDLGRQGVSIRQDEDVERVRRAHLNDLENIPAFLAASFIYIMTEPNFLVASWLIRVGVIARIGHTIKLNCCGVIEIHSLIMTVFDALNYNNQVFCGYITWGGILLIKMLLMAFLTGVQRTRKSAFENPEDLGSRGETAIKKDPDVERVRRAHLNDLENIPAFLFAALFFVCSEPHPGVALWLIRIAVIARILHTIVYAIYPIRQPARGICFLTCLFITVFMIVWMTVSDALSYNNELFRIYITWGGLLMIKLLLMAPFTAFHRLRSGAIENPEDVIRSNNEIKKDESVERVRRAHLNDLENIPAFLIAALMYVMSEPDPDVASWLIRIAVIARICHTLVYAVYPIRQPARFICFIVTVLITAFMILWSMVHFFKI
ncbi:CLUMA_CG010045, isoform A [Clunio marinus]|uniref:Microsomal glutathione S-transferase 1 n=1 Tax=Clunio marinus TaxID=568069 RepID=A0A1J1I942_9DIPT|nr:CLUMA_CG010045, isoform A [Clunio marinus]